jgi:uncharacterized phage protein (TIGR01671 family)
MREIKLRVWDKENECWLSSRIHLIGLDGTIWRTCATGDESLDSNRYILVQYTGLHDKNGKEIYEGDILRFNKLVYACSWENLKSGWNIGELNAETSEVIGNIYENPELLS